MVSVIVKAALIVHFLHLIVKVASESPCPTYFRYNLDKRTGEYSGVIEIPSPPKGVNLHLSVSLSIAVVLPSKYVGRLELAKSKEQSVKAIQQGRPLLYDLHFPLRRPIPSLTAIQFNKKVICSGPPASGPVVTSIVLHHTLYPPGALPPDQNEDDLYNFPTPSPILPTSQPSIYSFPPTYGEPFLTEKPQDAKTQLNIGQFVNDDKCGMREAINPLIFSGQGTTRGQWPWLVAIYTTTITYRFQCAGSLLTNSHVLTCAHCVNTHNGNVHPGTLEVSMGRFRLLNFREKGSVNREVLKYEIHPDYNQGGNADSDLAVLFLREKVEYTAIIKPICIWLGSTSVNDLVGKIGNVVGWGLDEKGNQNVHEPQLVQLPVVAQDVCLWSNADFSRVTSNRTFCAGAKDGRGPCNGDSGSGFVIYDRPSDRYYLRGVVSRSLLDKTTQSCDLNEYIIYVNVAQYTEWIMKQISQR